MLNTHQKQHCILTMYLVPIDTNLRSNLKLITVVLKNVIVKIVKSIHKVI